MSTTVTRSGLQHQPSEILFGGAANTYYAHPDQRHLWTEVTSNDYGQVFAAFGVGRVVAGHGLVQDWTKYQSPLLDSVEAAEAWAAAFAAWAVDNYTGQMDSPRPPAELEADLPTHSVCPGCGRFDTLKVTQEAYGDRTDCTECSHSSWYSIGD